MERGTTREAARDVHTAQTTRPSGGLVANIVSSPEWILDSVPGLPGAPTAHGGLMP